MSKNDKPYEDPRRIEEVLRVLKRHTEDLHVAKRASNREGKSSRTEKTDSTEEETAVKEDNPIGKARETVGVIAWERFGKLIPLASWIGFVIVLIIIVSFVVVWIARIGDLLGFWESSNIKDIKIFIEDVYAFLSGAASTSLLFLLSQKRRR